MPEAVRRDPHIQQGHRLRLEGDCTAAIAAYSQSERQGWATKYIADCLLRQKRYDEANAAYKISVQLNPLNRTRPSYNEIVRRMGTREHVFVVDLEAALEAASPTGIPDPDVFFDYCHMKWRGYADMARTIT